VVTECAGAIETISFDHKAGTKSYVVMIVTTKDNGPATVFYRYGKRGAPGQAMCETFSSSAHAQNAASKKMREKERGGYRQVKADAKAFFNDGELKISIGPVALPVVLRSCADGLTHVGVPDYSSTSVSTVPELYVNQRSIDAAATRARDDKAREETARLLASQEQERVIAAKAAEQIHQQQMQERNPTWGSF
jgi:predicted DNA-binding WGR domain protein